MAVSPETWRTVGLVLAVSLGGTTLGNQIIDQRPDPFTGSEAYRLCKKIESNMPPLEYRIRLRSLEEHARSSGYKPPKPRPPIGHDICDL